MDISVIPAYNEEQNIQAAMLRARDALRPFFECFNRRRRRRKPGRTPEIANACLRNPEIYLIHNTGNKGQGESILMGFGQTTGEFLAIERSKLQNCT